MRQYPPLFETGDEALYGAPGTPFVCVSIVNASESPTIECIPMGGETWLDGTTKIRKVHVSSLRLLLQDKRHLERILERVNADERLRAIQRKTMKELRRNGHRADCVDEAELRSPLPHAR